jgi:hypothetical protein
MPRSTTMSPMLTASRRVFLGSLSTLWLAGCAVLDGPRSFTITSQELESLLEKRFPLDRRMLEVLDVSVSTPQLRLLPERNRLGTSLEVSTRDRLFGNSWRGRLALDAALRWEPSDSTLRLQGVRVNEFSFDGAETFARRDQAERLAALLAERVLEDFTVYRLTPERQARLQRLGVTPGGVNVTRGGVEITFAPTAR